MCRLMNPALCLSLFFPMVAAAVESVPLPVSRVVLYKNGIGYFEHLGSIRGSQAVELNLPSAQLNDVLKSLTVIDLGQGRITSVGYDSVAPLERRLKELPIDLNKAQSLIDFLNQIRGTGIEIRSPMGLVKGSLIGAELRTHSSNHGMSTEVTELSVFTPAGEIRTIELETAAALRLTDSRLVGEVQAFLDLRNSTNRRDLRRLKIQTEGQNERQLFVSYTAEAPIWKTTYRVVLDPQQKPLLQGWAIVDNTTTLDWNNVELSLVSGAPVSFVQDISRPVYSHRPIVPLGENLRLMPQTHEGTLEEKEKNLSRDQVADHRRDSRAPQFAEEMPVRLKEGAAQARTVVPAPPPQSLGGGTA